jgi:hypothetical protein
MLEPGRLARVTFDAEPRGGIIESDSARPSITRRGSSHRRPSIHCRASIDRRTSNDRRASIDRPTANDPDEWT